VRTLLTYLLAEQKKLARVPYLRVEVRDHFGGTARLHWETLYSGAEAAGPHAAAIPTDGSLNRLRVESNALYRQRVTTPGPGSDFSTWTLWRAATALCALARYGANLLAFAVDAGTPTQIYWATSTDNGASWGSWALLTTAAGTIAHIAAASKTNGDTLVIFAVGATVYRIKRVSSVWGSIVAWTNTANSITGLAVHYWLDFNLVITGTETATLHPRVWHCIYGDGYSEAVDAWTVLRSITEADAGTTHAFHSPFLTAADTFRAIYRHQRTTTVAHDRHELVAMPIAADYVDNLWTEPRPFDLDHDYGIAITSTSTATFWLTTPSRVYRATYPATLDLSADVLSCIAHDYPFDQRGATITLRNDDGRYNSPGSGALTALTRGARLNVGPGYYVPQYADNEWSLGPSYYIESITHTATPGQRELVLGCVSTWGWLAQWRPGRSYRWPAGTRNYFQLISAILAKAGLEFSCLASSTKMTDVYPDFAITPGYDPPPYIARYHTYSYYVGIGRQRRRVDITSPVWVDPQPRLEHELPFASGLAAIQTLFSHLQDCCLSREDLIYGKLPLAADASQYTFGTDHAIIASSHTIAAVPDRFLAIGDANLVKEIIDTATVDQLHDRPIVVHDKAMTTADDVTDRANREARYAEINSHADSLTIPPHCGLELWDVVTINEPTLGIASAKRRVTGITLHFDRSGQEPVYHQIVKLGLP
jgi:hypothetical protein